MADRETVERVLAIAATREALAESNVWRLLQAGASDVIAWESAARSAAHVAARLQRLQRDLAKLWRIE